MKINFWTSILGVGSEASEWLQESLNHWKLINATEDELLKIDGIGEIVAQSIIKYFLIDENKILEQLISIGINPVYAEQEIEINNVFYDKNFVITVNLSLSQD